MTAPEQRPLLRRGSVCLWTAGALILCGEILGLWLAMPFGPWPLLAARYFGAALAVVCILLALLMWDGSR